MRWQVASDLRFRVAISEPETFFSAGFLAMWLRQQLRLCDLGALSPVRFSSLAVWGWNSSSSSGFRFRQFLCKKGFLYFSLTGKDGSGFGSWKTVPAVPVPLSVSGKTVPTVPVSGSVPEPPCKNHPNKTPF